MLIGHLVTHVQMEFKSNYPTVKKSEKPVGGRMAVSDLFYTRVLRNITILSFFVTANIYLVYISHQFTILHEILQQNPQDEWCKCPRVVGNRHGFA